MDAKSQRLLVIIPAFNEQATIGKVIRDILDANRDVLVIDDGSQDDTSLVSKHAGARVLRLSMNLGVGGALRCGFRYAVENGYNAVVQCDADGQHNPNEIVNLLEVAEISQAHLVIGSRFKAVGGFRSTRIRRVPIRLMAAISSRATDTSITDPTSGFRYIGEPLLSQFSRSFPTHYLGDTFDALVEAGRCGYRVMETDTTMRERGGGSPSTGSLMSFLYVLRSCVTICIGNEIRLETFGDSE